MTQFTESVVEEAALAWLEGVGCCVAHGSNIAPETPGKTPGKTLGVILQLLNEEPDLAIMHLATRLQSIGPDKGGHWKVIE